MKLARAFLLVALLGNGWLFSQSAPAPANSLPASASSHPSTAIVAGVVTKDPGSDPVKKAIVELIAESQSMGENYTAVTAVDGSFRIEDVAAGRYLLFVERTGYRQMGKSHRHIEGRTLALSAGQELKDLMIRLQAAAVVEGRVTDEDGDPMPEAQVAVLRQSFSGGRSRWDQVGGERTNDLGEYRIAGIAAGNYFVSVTPPPDFRSLIETSAIAPSGAHQTAATEKPAPPVYQKTYYPGTRDPGQAGSIQLHAGDDFPANFSLTPGPSLTIRGSVVNLPAGSSPAIMLQSADYSLVMNGAEVRKDGSFEIRGVSPGAYTILATVDNAPVPMVARQKLQLTSANVEGVRLAPQAGGSVHGRLRMEAGNAAGARPDPTQMFLLLRPADRDDDTLNTFTMGEISRVARVNADGSFEFEDVPPGRYSVQISESARMPDWFLKSTTSGGRDATDSGFTVSGSTTVLDLLASANGAVADGVVTIRNNEYANDRGADDRLRIDEPAADAVVVAVPEERFRGNPDRYRRAVADQAGRFTLRGLAPGDYIVFAWESVETDAFYNPEFLRACEGQGKALHVSEGERVNVQLKAIPAVDPN